MDANSEFALVTEGFGIDVLSQILGSSVDTVRRWKSGRQRPPESALILARLICQGDMVAIGPKWDGFHIGPDGMWVPGFRRAFSPADVKETFWRLQELGMLRHEVQRLGQELKRVSEDLDRSEGRASYYRGIAREVSKIGLCFSLPGSHDG